jgi:hypothetical protein
MGVGPQATPPSGGLDGVVGRDAVPLFQRRYAVLGGDVEQHRASQQAGRVLRAVRAEHAALLRLTCGVRYREY